MLRSVQIGAAPNRKIELVAGIEQLDERDRVRAAEPARLGQRAAIAHPFEEASKLPDRGRLTCCCVEISHVAFATMSDDAERERRIAFAIPPIHRPDPIDALLNPEDEDDRSLLIMAAHPDVDFEEETDEFNPRLHLALHEIVAKQLIDLEPPETWETAQRLERAGYHQHEILHMLGSAISGEIWHALQGDRPPDRDAHLAALAALPDSWERQRPGGPAPPASRASHASEAKRRRRAQRTARRNNRRR